MRKQAKINGEKGKLSAQKQLRISLDGKIGMVDRAGFEPATFRFRGLLCLANRTFFGPFLGMAYQAELPARPLPYNAQMENNHYGCEPSVCA